MSNSGFRSIIWRLRLRDVHDTPTHAPDEDHATRALSLDHVLRNLHSAEVRSVDVHAPELLHAVVRVVLRFEVLGEAGGGYEDVYVRVVLCEDFRDAGADGGRGGDVGCVGGYCWEAVGRKGVSGKGRRGGSGGEGGANGSASGFSPLKCSKRVLAAFIASSPVLIPQSLDQIPSLRFNL